MTYDEFKAAYLKTFNAMMSYKPSECGSSVYAEKLAALADEYPEFAEQAENEAA